MNDLDRVIHEPARLRIATVLAGVEWADFGFLLTVLKLTRGNLSSHIDRMEKAGYIEVRKQFNGKIPHTDYRLTPTGKEALDRYWGELDDIRATTGKKSVDSGT
jgi:DNA-binding transcriptional ArsR family regulator